MEQNVFIRYDEARSEFVITLEVKGLRTFEASGQVLSEAFSNLAEQLDQEGI